MKIERLDKKSYAKLKMFSYNLYFNFGSEYLDADSEPMVSLLEKYSDFEKQVVINTLRCPYDIELYNFMYDRKIDDASIKLCADTFDISKDVIIEKITECYNNNFIDCVGEGLIDYNVTHRLSSEFAEKLEEKKKIS